MSFKVKKWGLAASVLPTDGYADFSAMAGNNTTGYTFSWMGKMVFCGYDNANGGAEIYLIFDPMTQAWSGPFSAPAGITKWNWHSDLSGDDRRYLQWGNEYVIAVGMAGYGGTYDNFYGIDSGFNWSVWEVPQPVGTWGWTYQMISMNFGCVGGQPARAAYQWWMTSYMSNDGGSRVVVYGPNGLIRVEAETADPTTHLPIAGSGGLPAFNCVPFDSGVEAFAKYFASYPLTATEATSGGTGTMTVSANILPIGGDAYMWMDTGSGGHWALASSPLAPVTFPYSTWSYRMAIWDCGDPLDQGDLDGVGHGASLAVTGNVTRGGGFWCSHDGNHIYVLDSTPPAGMARQPVSYGTDAIGWIGECAIRPSLRVQNVLPGSIGLAGSVVERSQHLIANGASIYKRQGQSLTLSRTLKIDVSSYPVIDPEWYWPGSTDGVVENFWQGMCADGPTSLIWGGMPDFMFGMYWVIGDPPGPYTFVPEWRGLGVTANEALDSIDPTFTHTLGLSNTIGDTVADVEAMPADFVGSPAGQIIGMPDFPGGPVVVYFANAKPQSEQPSWKAMAWRVSADAATWTKIADWSDIGPPGLGETDWTVWSVAPIRACRALPQGGFLLGASLYFAPWSSWEYTVGSRDATFMDTGKGYVPGKPGLDGPFVREHVPEYWACEVDSSGRSLYGPDALLLYDHTGAFVTHLNTADVYPPDGRQILVTREAIPRVIFKVYREGTYSDFAEGWGAYHRYAEDGEVATPLYACYDLMTAKGTIVPGLGRFRGFLDMYDLGPSISTTWRWTMPNSLYDPTHPNYWWGGDGFRCQLRPGLGGMGVTPLSGRGGSSRGGVRGVGSRA